MTCRSGRHDREDGVEVQDDQQGRGGEVTFEWNGTLKGDEIAMKRMVTGREGQPQEFVLKREK